MGRAWLDQLRLIDIERFKLGTRKNLFTERVARC